MRTKKMTQGLGALLVSILLLFTSACATTATTHSSRSPSASPPPSPSAHAPSKWDITIGIQNLIKPLLRDGHLAPIEYSAVFKVERDASGRWLASAHLAPPMTASSWPANIVVVKDPEGWQIVSLKVDKTFGGSAPTVRPTPKPSRAEISRAVRRFPTRKDLERVTIRAMSRDGAGRWWVTVLCIGSPQSSVVGPTVVMIKDGNRWRLFSSTW